MIEVFHEQMDQLYWSGFAVQLKEDGPEYYRWDLNEFTKIYN